MTNAVLFKSATRFEAFEEKLRQYDVNVTVLDFGSQEWVGFDYSNIDIVIYFPTFKFSSNHPLALYEVCDNLQFIKATYPSIRMFPDPGLIAYYSDKYRQLLYLKSHKYPIPETYALVSAEALDIAEQSLGFPMVLKNRFGAGGDYVFQVHTREELEKYYKLSTFDFFHAGGAAHFWRMLTKRTFYYWLIKRRRMDYPFLSAPLLAQEFVPHERDLKAVVRHGKVVEAHWRRQVMGRMWKMNIDGGGVGEWSRVPREALELSERLARGLQATWINVELLERDGSFLISEFSPVWHHYAYKEKAEFVYGEDYNIDMPLERALELEELIVESLAKPEAREDRTMAISTPQRNEFVKTATG
jgi:glutathione synthase/RimK-type ligase-like ATP-grasp enzyme